MEDPFNLGCVAAEIHPGTVREKAAIGTHGAPRGFSPWNADAAKEDAMFPATTKRVAQNTADTVNQSLRAKAEDRVTYYAENPDLIPARLRALDAEWDIERVLETNAATLAFAGTVLGARVDRRFYAIPALITGFLFQHAIQGWCPPLPALRRLGFRTATEIADERVALKILRGDFKDIPISPDASPRERARQALVAART